MIIIGPAVSLGVVKASRTALLFRLPSSGSSATVDVLCQGMIVTKDAPGVDQRLREGRDSLVEPSGQMVGVSQKIAGP